MPDKPLSDTTEIPGIENYSEEVSVEYWDSLMQSVATWEKLTEEDMVVCAFDSFD